MNSMPGTSWLYEVTGGHDRLLEAIVGALPEPFFVLDRDGRYVAVLGGVDNTRYHDGRPLVGKLMHEVLPRATADRFLAIVHEALATGRVVHHEYTLSSDEVEGVESHADVPDQLWFEGHIAPLPSVEGRADLVVWMIFNVTESRVALQRLERQQRELEALARIDPLTELLNRRSFFAAVEDELERVRRTGGSVAMIVFDLDRFKTINDTWGHAAGDAALVAVAELLRAERPAGDAISRLGGEEFAVVVRDADLAAGRLAAERLRAAIAGLEIAHEGATISLTASFGVTELRATDEQPDAAVRRADAAMFTAKHHGRNCVETDPPDPGV